MACVDRLVTQVEEAGKILRTERWQRLLSVLLGYISIGPLWNMILEFTGPYGVHAHRIPFDPSHLPRCYPSHQPNEVTFPHYADYSLPVRFAFRTNNAVVRGFINTIARIDDDGVQTRCVGERIIDLQGSKCGDHWLVWLESRKLCIVNWSKKDIVPVDIDIETYAWQAWSEPGQCFAFSHGNYGNLMVWICPFTGKPKHITKLNTCGVLLTSEGQSIGVSNRNQVLLCDHLHVTTLDLNHQGGRLSTFDGNGLTIYSEVYANTSTTTNTSTGAGHSFRLELSIGAPIDAITIHNSCMQKIYC